MLDTQKFLSISLVGPFSVTDRYGNDLTPTGRRSRAILAMLALSPTGRRSRGWLAARLWSNKPEKNARSSLRTEVSGLRRHMASVASDVILTSGDDLGLDLELVEINTDASGLPEHAELLEGVDVNDPMFEEWCREERAFWYDRWSRGDCSSPQAQAILPDLKPLPLRTPKLIIPTLHIPPFESIGSDPETSEIAHAVQLEVSHMFSVMADAYFVLARNPSQLSETAYVLTGTVRKGTQPRLHAMLNQGPSGVFVWSDTFDIDPNQDLDGIQTVARTIVESVQKALNDGGLGGQNPPANVSQKAWEAYQRARGLEARSGRKRLAPSIACYRDALAIDPDFTMARVGLAFRLLDGLRNCWLDYEDGHLAEVEATIQMAKVQTPNNLWSQSLEAFYLCARGSIDQGLELMQRIVSQNAESSEMTGCLGAIHDYAGEYSIGRACHEYALNLSPHPPTWVHTNLAMNLMITEDSDALPKALQILDRDPENIRALMVKSVCEYRDHRMQDSQRTAQTLRFHDPWFTAAKWRSPWFFKDPTDYRTIADTLVAIGF